MTAPQPTSRKHGKNAFMFVIVMVMIDLMGFGIIAPVMPDLLEEITNLSAEEAVAWGGALTATYALVNFLAMPTIGNLSDRYGRRVVLLASIGTLAVDFLIMGLANSLWLLFLGRALAGLSSATLSTANAYIADVTEPEKRGAAFGMVGAAFGIGFIIGPAIGAAFSLIDTRAPFFAAAVLAGLNFLYGTFVLPESLDPENRRRFDWKRANPFGAFAHFRKLPMVMWFILSAGIFWLGQSVYPATWSFHGDIRYGWEAWEIGLSLTLVGLGSAIVQGVLIGRIIERIGLTNTALLGYIATISAFLAFAFAGLGWVAYLIIPLSALGGLAGPAINTIMSNTTPKNEQGELHGANASLQALAMVISPLILTQTLHQFSKETAPVYFPGAAFMLAAIIAALSVIPFLVGVRVNKDKALSAENLTAEKTLEPEKDLVD